MLVFWAKIEVEIKNKSAGNSFFLFILVGFLNSTDNLTKFSSKPVYSLKLNLNQFLKTTPHFFRYFVKKMSPKKMKKIIFTFLLIICLQSCYFSRPCPMKSCHVEMEHMHEGKKFSPHGIFHLKFHYVGEKIFKKDKNKQNIMKKRKEIEKG